MSRFGNILFVAGFGILIVGGASLPFWKNFDASFMSIVLAVLVAGAVLIVAGEMMRFSGSFKRRRKGDTFMDFYREVRRKGQAKSSRPRKDLGACSFCGAMLAENPVSIRPVGGKLSVEPADLQAGQCEECGRIACPQCAFKKGLEMGLRSFRCPACGGRIK